MSRLFETYRALHDQTFLPTFVRDHIPDAKKMIEGCVEAGVRVIEYTLRRPDANTMIPWIRENYPDLYILVGSTLDDAAIVAKQRVKFPQLLTLEELDAMEVDGFVSLVGFSADSMKQYHSRRILIPAVSTIEEAFSKVAAGAHFVKVPGSNPDLIKSYRWEPAFDYCPLFATGGLTLDRIPIAVEAGAVVASTGFNLILKACSVDVSVKEIAAIIRQYMETAQNAKRATWPDLAKAADADDKTWLKALPHYHPF